MAGVALAGMMMAGPAMAQRAVPEGVPGFSAPVSMPLLLGNPGEWVRSDDYPSAALRRGEQGITGFAATVDSAGRVESCAITQSSGSVELDEATCRLVSSRALFKPATDAKGQPTLSVYRSRIRWTMPQDMPPPPASTMIVSFMLAPDGRVSDCKAEFPVLPAGQVPPPICEHLPFTEGYRDAAGKLVARRVIMTRKVEVLPVDSADQAPTGRKP